MDPKEKGRRKNPVMGRKNSFRKQQTNQDQLSKKNITKLFNYEKTNFILFLSKGATGEQNDIHAHTIFTDRLEQITSINRVLRGPCFAYIPHRQNFPK